MMGLLVIKKGLRCPARGRVPQHPLHRLPLGVQRGAHPSKAFAVKSGRRAAGEHRSGAVQRAPNASRRNGGRNGKQLEGTGHGGGRGHVLRSAQQLLQPHVGVPERAQRLGAGIGGDAALAPVRVKVLEEHEAALDTGADPL